MAWLQLILFECDESNEVKTHRRAQAQAITCFYAHERRIWQNCAHGAYGDQRDLS